MHQISLEQLQTHPEEVIKWLQTPDEAVTLSLGETKAVLQSADAFSRQQEALKMMQLLLNGEQDIAQQKLTPHEVFMEEMENLLRT